MTIKNIVFDVGNVLFAYDPMLIQKQLIPNSRHHLLYKKHLFEAEIWQTLDEGIISPEDVATQLIQQFPEMVQSEIMLLLTDFWKYLQLIPEMKQTFETLASNGYPLYILSNFHSAAYQKLLEAFPFMNLAKGKVISGDIKLIKPDPQIYYYLLKSYTLSPEETLFIDDREDNILAAQTLGIQTIPFTNPNEVNQKLATLQLLPKAAY